MQRSLLSPWLLSLWLSLWLGCAHGSSGVNVTAMLHNEWLPSRQAQVKVERSVMETSSYRAKVAWLGAVTAMCLAGYDFRVDSGDEQGVFTRRGGADAAAATAPCSIPAVVHQTWKTVDIRTHSPDAVECNSALRRHSPDFFHVHWTDFEIMDFIKEFYADQFNYYLRLNMNIKRADIARYLILHKFGGVYFDLDVELKVPLRQLVPPNEASFISYRSKEFEKRKDPFAGNAFFACSPASPVVWAVVRHAMGFSNPAVKDGFGVLLHTGPMALGLIVQRVQSRPADFVPNQIIKIFNSSVIGNVEDGPWGAVHRRKHHWGPVR